MFGTKCPSITSRWIQSAPAASTLRISSPSLEKSEASTDGAMTRGRGANGWDMALPGMWTGRNGFRVTRAYARGNAGESLLLWAENSAATAFVAGCCKTLGARKALILLGFSAGTAFAEYLARGTRPTWIASTIGVLVMFLAFGAASSAIDSLF